MAITRDEMIMILADADPVGLMAGGTPPDEYAAILALQGVPKVSEIPGCSP